MRRVLSSDFPTRRCAPPYGRKRGAESVLWAAPLGPFQVVGPPRRPDSGHKRHTDNVCGISLRSGIPRGRRDNANSS